MEYTYYADVTTIYCKSAYRSNFEGLYGLNGDWEEEEFTPSATILSTLEDPSYGGSSATQHNLVYTDNSDGTHNAACTDDGCIYTITNEAHTYDALGVCLCGAKESSDTGDSGTTENTILISTAEDLKALSDRVYNGDTCEGLSFKLTADIDLEGSASNTFRPIGTGDTKYFGGSFDGCYHTISGLYVSYYSYSALFGSVKNATIENLTVRGYVKGQGKTAGIVGCAIASTLRNLRNYATVEPSYTNSSPLGGVVGYIGGSSSTTATPGTTVDGCCNYGTVTGSYNSSSAAFGGVVGYAYSSSSVTNTIINCYNVGEVKSTLTTSGYGF